MTTTLEIYRAALEHIRDGSDAVCTDCGWMGKLEQASLPSFMVEPLYACPLCDENNYIAIGADGIAAYVLAEGEKG